ncbi:hypothetical protein PIB30_097775 [Stylosanthes scabra]|uniref:F-box domain-containing protein n=1 Tax=Stylosanthes scabra TaxID=79078 RepID=A0ABU6UVU9_9FABA|nr:hypothetical protein [Stylosanthes scabra]
MNWQNPNDRKNRRRQKSGLSMEKEKHKQKSIYETLPLELIQRILLRLPVKQLARLRCVSKLWQSLISDPEFVEYHLHYSPAPTHVCLFESDSTEGHFVHLEQVLNGNNYSIKSVSFPFKKKPPSDFRVMGSCRGFAALFVTPCCLYGFGYEQSHDDYLVVVASFYRGGQQRLDCFSLRTNSWINLDFAITQISLGFFEWKSCGLFLNGSIHWLSSSLINPYGETLLIFDLKEIIFSKISLPEQLVKCHSPELVVLGGCLAFYSRDYGKQKTEIWVMKEYNVQSSWTLYEIPGGYFIPLCLSNDSDVIALASTSGYRPLKFVKYSTRGELFQQYSCSIDYANYSVYTESLLLLPNDSKPKDNNNNKKKNVM